MKFIATVKLNSELDSSLKAANCKDFILYSNEFSLIKNVYTCCNIITLQPLLEDKDIEIVATDINLVELEKQ